MLFNLCGVLVLLDHEQRELLKQFFADLEVEVLVGLIEVAVDVLLKFLDVLHSLQFHLVTVSHLSHVPFLGLLYSLIKGQFNSWRLLP